MFSLLSRTTSDWVTLRPTAKIFTGEVISISPLTTLVEIFRAWKNPVWPGSMPVLPGGIVRSTSDITPALAAAGLRLSLTILRISPRFPSQKIKPTFSLHSSLSLSNSGLGF